MGVSKRKWKDEKTGKMVEGKSWVVDYYNSAGKRIVKTVGPSKREAEAVLREVTALKRNGMDFERIKEKFKGELPTFLSLLSSHSLIKIDMKMVSPCVYILIKENEVVYVGQSVNLLQRLAQHREKDFDAAYYLPIPITDLIKTEKALIQDFNPPLNKTHIVKTKAEINKEQNGITKLITIK